jgi:mono/diheme cytochrome c family protein
MKLVLAPVLLSVIAIAGAAIFIYEGWFEISADVPHSAIVFRLMQTARDRAIAVRAKDISVPSLDKPELIAKGARDYSEMCTGCHLAPGNKESELRQGLYPQPPDLTQRGKATPAEMFWVIKHGIKMSAMPAWGPTHDDERIWDMVAFLKNLPELTPEQYEALAGARGESHHHDHAAGAAPVPEDHDHDDDHHQHGKAKPHK